MTVSARRAHTDEAVGVHSFASGERRAQTDGAVENMDYLPFAKLVPCGGCCCAILYDNAYNLMLSLVARPLLGVECFLYFRPACTTRQYNLPLLRRLEAFLDQVGVTDCLAA